jgi:hypothetical protein
MPFRPFILALFSAFLMACTSTPTPTGKPQLKALTRVDGPVADALRTRGITFSNDVGTDGFIVDGDYTSGAGIAAMSEIKAALEAGKAVVFTDLDNADDRPGLAKLIGFSSNHDTYGVLYRYVQNDGYTTLRIEEFPSRVDAAGNLRPIDAKTLNDETSAFVDRVFPQATLHAQADPAPRIPMPLHPIPKGLTYANIQVHFAFSATLSGAKMLPEVFPGLNYYSNSCGLFCEQAYFKPGYVHHDVSALPLARIEYTENLWIMRDSLTEELMVAGAPLLISTPTGMTKGGDGQFLPIASFTGGTLVNTKDCNDFGVKKVRYNWYGFQQVGWQPTWSLLRPDSTPVEVYPQSGQASPRSATQQGSVTSSLEADVDFKNGQYDFKMSASSGLTDWKAESQTNDSSASFSWASVNPMPPKLYVPGQDVVRGQNYPISIANNIQDYWKQYIVPSVAFNALGTGQLVMYPMFGFQVAESQVPQALLIRFRMNGMVEAGNHYAGSDCHFSNYEFNPTVRVGLPVDPISAEYTFLPEMLRTR